MPGTRNVQVDFKAKEARVVVDNDPVKFEGLRDALKEAGFDVEKMNFEDPRKATEERVGDPGASSELNDLSDDLRELRAAFNEARGKVRLVMLLSPG